MTWLRKLSQQQTKHWGLDLPLAGSVVGGLRVRDNVDNTNSIGSSAEDYEILPGIREVPTSEFPGGAKQTFTNVRDINHCRNLANALRDSGEITPLIIMVNANNDDAYILEGVHRIAALNDLGVTSFPALIVVSYDELA